MSKPRIDHRILFLDLETSGTDPSTGIILEVGIVILSRRLRDVPGGRFQTVTQADPSQMKIDPDVRDMHTKSKLFDECVQDGVSLDVAENKVLDFLDLHDFDPFDKIVIGGFSPSFDVGFLKSDMPILAERLSHRTFDVSTLRELVARLAGQDVYAWRKGIHALFPDADIHRALPDCDAAIRELREYVKFFDLDAMREAVSNPIVTSDAR